MAGLDSIDAKCGNINRSGLVFSHTIQQQFVFPWGLRRQRCGPDKEARRRARSGREAGDERTGDERGGVEAASRCASIGAVAAAMLGAMGRLQTSGRTDEGEDSSTGMRE